MLFLSFYELVSPGSVFVHFFLLFSFQLISEHLVFVFEDSAFFLFLEFLLLCFLQNEFFLELVFLPFAFVVSSLFILNLLQVLLFLHFFDSECNKLGYVVFLVFDLLFLPSDFLFNEVLALFFLQAFVIFHLGLLSLLDSSLCLLDSHEHFSLFLQFFLCLLKLDFSLLFLVKLFFEASLIFDLHLLLPPCLLDFGLFLLFCFHEVIDFGLSDHVVFQNVAVLAVIFLPSLLFHLQLFLHFLSFHVGFLLLNGQFLDFELFSFDLSSDFVHEFFLLQFVFDLPYLNVSSATCCTVVGSVVGVKAFGNEFVSLFDKKVDFLFSPFFVVLEFDFEAFFIIHCIAVDFFHILKFLNEELVGFNALATACLEASGTVKERFEPSPLIEIF